MKKIKGYFLTGIALLFPVVVTLIIVIFFLNLLTNPFMNLVKGALLNQPFLFFSNEQVLAVISKVLIIVVLFLFTVCVGFFTRMVAVHYFIRFGDYILHRIPIVNKIYKAAQDVVKTLFAENRQTFSQVVLVPFPQETSYSIGLVTRDSIPESGNASDWVSVFVPATPNPTMGFLLMVPRSKLLFLDMKVDDALTAIISCGIMTSKITESNEGRKEK